jgi:hypothetical protein
VQWVDPLLGLNFERRYRVVPFVNPVWPRCGRPKPSEVAPDQSAIRKWSAALRLGKGLTRRCVSWHANGSETLRLAAVERKTQWLTI